MEYGLEDVIRLCKSRYGLKVTKANTPKYKEFLKRQLKNHPDYDLSKITSTRKHWTSYPYLRLLVDKLQLFSYLIGETKIYAGYNENGFDGKHMKEKRIESVYDLYLLRPKELGGNGAGNLEESKRKDSLIVNQTDENLLSLYRAFSKNAHNYPKIWKNWSGTIDELGEDPLVIKHFKQKINSEMVHSCKSPNPNTFSYGGYRR